MVYINGYCQRSKKDLETIDEFKTRREAVKMLKEYRLAYQGTGFNLYLSQRSCKDWK